MEIRGTAMGIQNTAMGIRDTAQSRHFKDFSAFQYSSSYRVLLLEISRPRLPQMALLTEMIFTKS